MTGHDDVRRLLAAVGAYGPETQADRRAFVRRKGREAREILALVDSIDDPDDLARVVAMAARNMRDAEGEILRAHLGDPGWQL